MENVFMHKSLGTLVMNIMEYYAITYLHITLSKL